MAPTLEPGAIFAGDFRIVRPLDAGGMGSIFVVEQLSTGNQRALKLMLPQLVADPGLRQRFLQEARVGSRIASDHVVQVISAGIEPTQNVPWLVMELLQGEELDKKVKREGPLAPRDIVEIVKQLGHALSAAHGVGVVHRDLKPNNIFLCRPRVAGAAFLLKVLDFGIAKITADAQTSGTSGMGTPLWMAPEQTEARSHVGPGTDIWALGLIVFWMLTGQVYWQAATQGSTSVHAVLRELLMEPIVAPSVRAYERGRGQLVPAGFDAWFARAVERSLDKRYASVEQAVADLVSVLEGRASVGRPGAPGPTVAGAPLPGAMTGAAYASPATPAPSPHAFSQQQPQPQPQPTQQPTPQSSYQNVPSPQATSSATTGPSGHSAPGFAATAAPVKRSGGGLVLGIVIGLVVLLGAGGAVAFFVIDSKPKEHKHASSDDDDDDDSSSRRKRKKTDDEEKVKVDEGLTKAEQCKTLVDTLNATKARVEALEKMPNPGVPEIRAIADAFDDVARTTAALPITDADLKQDVADFGEMARDAAGAARAVADSAEVGNRNAMMKHKADLDAAAGREGPILASINGHCGLTP